MSSNNARKWEEAQEKAFTNWVNSLLAKVGKRVDDVGTDLSDGVAFIQFLELLSQKKCKHKYNPEPKDKINKIQNLHIGMRFLEVDLGLKPRGVGPEDFYDGNKKMIFGFLWTLYRRFRISMIRDDGSSALPDRDPTEREAEENLLKWCSNMTGFNITQFKTGFRDGAAFLSMAEKLADSNDALAGLAGLDSIAKLAAVFDFAEKNLNIPKLLDAEDVAAGTADERTLMLYTSLFYNAYEGRKKANKSEMDELKDKVVEVAGIEREAISKIFQLEDQLNMYNEELKTERYERMALERVVMDLENKAMLTHLMELREQLESHQHLLCRLQQDVQQKATGKLAPLWGPPQISADLSKSMFDQVDQLGSQLDEELQRISRIVQASEVKPITIGKKSGEKLLEKERES
ncbi:hypothetical protein SAMD00019534_018590 [Acytostelium subglobosum LB1]|uniref:hypothetical protein n=1 Tax=Acytostelium subglobosum LB1 TaxID=1410327 RepID=UPI00064510AC|nr:hypothetical protein SAMD00019534_018590 [Acytostelium subglobosum LB1]GAM18684.1 hypothetical protein SAMD00019534_018590 [Acytostelium subglobosum LB1]|eukprot:XP_012757904.1 hypothetical protein SAMD00019534_018590 [Acytostelium subglobosum LB1]